MSSFRSFHLPLISGDLWAEISISEFWRSGNVWAGSSNINNRKITSPTSAPWAVPEISKEWNNLIQFNKSRFNLETRSNFKYPSQILSGQEISSRFFVAANNLNWIIDEIQQKLHVLLKNVFLIEMCVFKIESQIFEIFDQILHNIRNFQIICRIIFWKQSKRRRTIATIIDIFFDIFVMIQNFFLI